MKPLIKGFEVLDWFKIKYIISQKNLQEAKLEEKFHLVPFHPSIHVENIDLILPKTKYYEELKLNLHIFEGTGAPIIDALYKEGDLIKNTQIYIDKKGDVTKKVRCGEVIIKNEFMFVHCYEDIYSGENYRPNIKTPERHLAEFYRERLKDLFIVFSNYEYKKKKIMNILENLQKKENLEQILNQNSKDIF